MPASPAPPSHRVPAHRRGGARPAVLDLALELLPLFRLSDSADDGAIQFAPPSGGRWRVLPAPGDRLPGTFDQDVYVELMHRWHDAGSPGDGALTFTLHAFLRSMGRKADGRTYEQLRAALARLERTTLESTGAYWSATTGAAIDASFTVLSAVVIERRRSGEGEQLALFPTLTAHEPGDARVTIAPLLRANVAAGHAVALSTLSYQSLSSPVARRLYRLLAAVTTAARHATPDAPNVPAELAEADAGHPSGTASPHGWTLPLERLAEQLPLAQRYPSHLQRVLQPAHEMLLAAGVVRVAAIEQHDREWRVRYEL